MSAWDNLSIREKAAMMRTAVSNGITNIDDIRREYNEFAEGGPTRKEIEDLFWQNRMDEAQAALNQVPQKAPTPIIDRELPELTVYPQRNYPDPYSIPQGEITPVTDNALSRAINNYTGELKYDLANGKVPSGEYTLPAAVLGATGAAGLAKAGEMAYAAGLTPLIMEGMNVPFAASGLNNLYHGNADWQTALEISPLGHYVMPIAKKIFPRLASKTVDKYAAIKEAYNRNPEISKVGNIDDYNDYLKTVFPESKIQDIQYHMGPKGIEELKGSTGEIWNTNPKAKGIYVSPTKEYPELIRKHTTDRIEKPSALKYLWRNLTGNWDKANAKYTEMYPVLINTKNPLYTSGDWTWGMNQNKYNEVFSNYDGIVNSGTKWYQRAYKMPETIVPSSDQTLILGSNKDLQGFKQFMSNKTRTPQITAENDIVASLNTEVNSKLPPAIKAAKAMRAADNDIKAMNAYHDANVAAYNEATGSSVKSIPFRTDTGGRRIKVLPKEDFDAAYLESRSNAPTSSVENVGGFYKFKDDTVYLRQNGSPSNAYHEFLHSDNYGITNPEVTKWRIDQLVDPEKIKDISPRSKSYYLSETEFPVHLRQQGENLGIKVGEPFPGEEAFDEMLLNTGHGGASVYVKGMSTDASLEDKKLAWKALNGTLFNYALPALGITTAATLSNQKALGGNLFADGGIHIKPSHRGRLTELKARTGKTEAELYNDGNPAHKKMVVFARNARKWHDLGGTLFPDGGSMNPSVGKAMQYFINRGLTDYQAAGLVGNLIRESSLDHKAVNKDSKAYGLAQWLGDRKTNLFKKYGNNPTFEQQLDYVWDELNSTHKRGLQMLKASKSAEEAARNAMGYYEFSSGPEKAIANMIKHGQDGESSMRKGVNFAMGILGQKAYAPQMQLPPNYNVMQNWELPTPQYTLDELAASGTMMPAKELPLTTRIPPSGERPNALLDLLAQYQYLDSLLSQ